MGKELKRCQRSAAENPPFRPPEPSPFLISDRWPRSQATSPALVLAFLFSLFRISCPVALLLSMLTGPRGRCTCSRAGALSLSGLPDPITTENRERLGAEPGHPPPRSTWMRPPASWPCGAFRALASSRSSPPVLSSSVSGAPASSRPARRPAGSAGSWPAWCRVAFGRLRSGLSRGNAVAERGRLGFNKAASFAAVEQEPPRPGCGARTPSCAAPRLRASPRHVRVSILDPCRPAGTFSIATWSSRSADADRPALTGNVASVGDAASHEDPKPARARLPDPVRTSTRARTASHPTRRRGRSVTSGRRLCSRPPPPRRSHGPLLLPGPVTLRPD